VVRGAHILDGTRIYLSDSNPSVRSPLTWTWRFPGDPQTLHVEDGTWQLSPGEPGSPDVAIETSPRDWADFVMGGGRSKPAFRMTGSSARIAEFESVFGLRPASGAKEARRPSASRGRPASPSARRRDRRP
jgi:hypothetical protein